MATDNAELVEELRAVAHRRTAEMADDKEYMAATKVSAFLEWRAADAIDALETSLTFQATALASAEALNERLSAHLALLQKRARQYLDGDCTMDALDAAITDEYDEASALLASIDKGDGSNGC